MLESKLAEPSAPTTMEREKARRINVAIWAYAYEMLSTSIVPDSVFDQTCKEIDTNIITDNAQMDNWFKKHFCPYTGAWVGCHPERTKIRQMTINLLCNLRQNYLDNLTGEWVVFKAVDKEPRVKGTIIKQTEGIEE